MKNLYFVLLRKTSKAIISMLIIMLFCGSIFIQNANAQLFDEPFTSSLNGWTAEIGAGDQVVWANTNSAGGTAGEVNFTGNSQTAIITDRLYSPAVNTTGMSSLTLTWNNYLYHYSSTSWTYGVSIETSTDGVIWHPTSWVTNPVTANIGPGLQTLTINNSDVGSATFRVSFTTNGQTFGFHHWYIDNPKLVSACINHTLYTVSGGGCNSGPVNLSGSQVGVDYQLYNGVTTVGSVVAGTGSAIAFGTQSSAGVYSVKTIGDATYCATTMTGSAIITTIPTPVISQIGINLHSSATTGNQWYNVASGLIAGAVNQNYPFTANGYYYCIVTISGCSSDTSNILHVVNFGVENVELNNKIFVYPNPSSDKMFVDFGQITEIPIVAKLYNSLGQVVFETTQAAMTKHLAIDVRNLNFGMYTLQIIFDKGIVNKEVIVQ
jgi:hypothetical protein